MKVHYLVGAAGLACLAYALYQLDEPWVTLATGLVLLLGAWAATDRADADAKADV